MSYVRGAGRAITALRVEGFGPSVEARCQALRGVLAGFGAIEELHTMNSAKLWREIRDVSPLLPDASLDLWRLSVPPAAGTGVMSSLAERIETNSYFCDWGCGQIWLATSPASLVETCGAIRAAVAPAGGHATLMRASREAREIVPVFHPQSDALSRMSQRLAVSFDPCGVLNPRRTS